MSYQITVDQAKTLADRYEARGRSSDRQDASDLRDNGHLGGCPFWDWQYVDSATDECNCIQLAKEDDIRI